VSYEVDFLPVGDSYGDAIVIRHGDDSGSFLHVVDGGRTDTADTILKHLQEYYPTFFINHMVVSHADNDHACGLIGVMKAVTVKHLWMNRPWLYADQVLHHFHGNFTLQGLINDIKGRHPYLVELEQLANAQGTIIHEVFQGASIGAFKVLAPTKARYIDSIPDLDKSPTSYRTEGAAPQRSGLLKSIIDAAKQWFDEAWDIETLAQNTSTSASNESCVVQYAELDGNGILLTADVGPVGLTEPYEVRPDASPRQPSQRHSSGPGPVARAAPATGDVHRYVVLFNWSKQARLSPRPSEKCVHEAGL
jgi:hypothetical protein